jgi:hypothetical protein
MTFSKAVTFGFLLFSWVVFALYRTGVSASVFAICILTFFATEAFDAYGKLAHRLTTDLRHANERADANEERIKQVVEAGIKMTQKVNELEARLTLDGVGRFAGIKR